MDKPLSIQRLSKYRRKSDTDPNKESLERYKWNIKLSQSIYPDLAILEVSLRNHIVEAFDKKYGNNWLSETSHILGNWQKEEIEKAKKKLDDKKKPKNRPDVIAALTFGFWVYLFSHNYKSLYSDGSLIKEIFPNMIGRQLRYDELFKILSSILDLRNRIFHHEPIFQWKDLLQKKLYILNILDWLDPKIYQHLDAKVLSTEDIYWNESIDNPNFALYEFSLNLREPIVDFLASYIQSNGGTKSLDEYKKISRAKLNDEISKKSQFKVIVEKSKQVIGLSIIRGNRIELLLTDYNSNPNIDLWLIDASIDGIGSKLIYCNTASITSSKTSPNCTFKNSKTTIDPILKISVASLEIHKN